MRIWSIHPKYLDAKGLVALWRETLLAKNVLLGNTKGYKNHPQLIRFKNSAHPLERIDEYLATVFDESVKRNYKFNSDKINWNFEQNKLLVTSGQLQFEFDHLKNKLKKRDEKKYAFLQNIQEIEPHPMFTKIKGKIENWEITNNTKNEKL